MAKKESAKPQDDDLEDDVEDVEEETSGIDDDELFEEDDDACIINMEEVEEMVFENLPKGKYEAIIEDVEYGMSNTSGKPMWTMNFTVVEGAYQGRKLRTWWSFSEKALGGTKTNIARIAPEVLTRTFNPKKIAEEGTLTGKRVLLDVIIEKYNDEDRNKIKGVYRSKTAGDDGDGFLDD